MSIHKQIPYTQKFIRPRFSGADFYIDAAANIRHSRKLCVKKERRFMVRRTTTTSLGHLQAKGKKAGSYVPGRWYSTYAERCHDRIKKIAR